VVVVWLASTSSSEPTTGLSALLRPRRAVDRFHYDPYTVENAWGYVLSFIHGEEDLAAEVCDGALAITKNDASVPFWEHPQTFGMRDCDVPWWWSNP
jgi:hypothetical protein